ncbi:hypothetical protein [Nonomuraea basaltis]|uniref:hypothetical protein n=1 Tax=Nonomuraea basaltis TaxID=2495887 RepID=UPI00110C456A|nr:hypothetical protein [Nonomuraea basaltis]TMR97562.1 hypothetical protein EJK15_17750 [Nonomuraea basaltis]
MTESTPDVPGLGALAQQAQEATERLAMILASVGIVPPEVTIVLTTEEITVSYDGGRMAAAGALALTLNYEPYRMLAYSAVAIYRDLIRLLQGGADPELIGLAVEVTADLETTLLGAHAHKAWHETAERRRGVENN